MINIGFRIYFANIHLIINQSKPYVGMLSITEWHKTAKNAIVSNEIFMNLRKFLSLLYQCIKEKKKTRNTMFRVFILAAIARDHVFKMLLGLRRRPSNKEPKPEAENNQAAGIGTAVPDQRQRTIRPYHC